MALSSDQNTKMEYQNIFLPHLKEHTGTTGLDQLLAQGLKLQKADIRRFTLIVQGYDNMIASLKHSNAQDEHDPTLWR
ncbi:hypothetical protein TNIN_468431 [Trichonephila inaurata madagascariensis]|uniref:Uncharacterized protein n=1 Tax=Trichonephila inaurata madagascariensis TaxID=2747483 RepID=A0A8X6XLB9_9ARAC|nr:hypothetical protein TNIN_468431 [Trichonephila inaurata madagascariensis]